MRVPQKSTVTARITSTIRAPEESGANGQRRGPRTRAAARPAAARRSSGRRGSSSASREAGGPLLEKGLCPFARLARDIAVSEGADASLDRRAQVGVPPRDDQLLLEP